jgi:two-component system response regulator BaeR
MNPRLLVVEDEKKLAEILTDYLKLENFEVNCVHRGDEALQQVKASLPDAILLDIMLPGMDGISLCKEIRRFSNVPILMLTARVEEIDRLLGLELGADDYICKPYSPREVVARVKAVLRRSQGELVGQSIAYQLDAGRLRVAMEGEHIELTAVEFHLFEKLTTEPGRIFSREQLMANMYSDNRIVSDRTVDSHIKKLRKKLAHLPSDGHAIQSVYGVGYRFQEC